MIGRKTKITIETHRVLAISRKRNAASRAGWKHFKQCHALYFYGLTVGGLFIAATLTASMSLFVRIALIVVGLFSWLLMEYIVHRFAFHSDAEKRRVPKILSAEHLEHHRYPKATDKLFMELPMSAPLAAAYFGLAWLTSGSWQRAAYLFSGLIAGYFAYEYVHYRAHHGACRSKPLRYLKRYHLLHHHQTPNARFSISSPLVDLLCRTFRRVKRRAKCRDESSPRREIGMQ